MKTKSSERRSVAALINKGTLPEIIQTILHGFTHQIARQARIYKTGASNEALHDLRVSIRQLRTNLEIYRPLFTNKAWIKTVQRQLKNLMKQTGSTRDAEVQLAWFRQHRPKSQKVLMPMLSMTQIFQYELRSRATVRNTWLKELEKVIRKIQLQIEKLPTEKCPLKKNFKTFYRKALKKQRKLLMRSASKVKKVEDEKAAHTTRIVAKKMRYHLMPFLSNDKRKRKAMKRLNALQDQLGKLHDLQMLKLRIEESRIEKAGRLIAFIVKHEKKIFQQFRQSWPPKKIARRFREILEIEADPFPNKYRCKSSF